MKLRALRLWNVRKFANRGIALEGIGDGVNVLSAENEFGKSTSFDALHAVFFQPYSGTPKAVQMLRPYSGGSPQIEVDIETDTGHFRINKQYYRGKHAQIFDLNRGQIIAQADEAEAWVSKLLRGGSTGPAGLLWVQQGVTDIGSGSKAEKDERKVREDLLASVTGDEVELLTGGRRMVRVLERTQVELDRFVTSTGKPKIPGPYSDALRLVDDLKQEENEFADQIEVLRSELGNRRIKLARLAEISDPATIEQRTSDINQAELDLQQAKDHAAQLITAEKQLSFSIEKQSLAKQRHDEFLAKMTTLSNLTEQLTAEEQQLAAARDTLANVQSADQSAHQELQLCSEAVEKLGQKLDQANRARASQEAKDKLQEVRTRLARAEKARMELETLQAACSALYVNDDDIEQLEKLANRITVLESIVQVESGTLTIDYLNKEVAAILNNGKRVAGSKTLNIITTEIFEIPDIGRITITPGSVDGANNRQSELRTAQQNLSESLSRSGFSSLDKAKDQQTEFKAKSSALSIKKTEVAAYSPEGLEQLRSHAARLEIDILPAPVEEFNIEEIETELQSARQKVQQANPARELARTSLETAKETYLRAEMVHKNTTLSLDRLKQELGTEDERQSHAQSLLDVCQRETTEANGARELVEKLKTDAPDLENVRANFERLKSISQRAETEGATLTNDIAELNGRITISSKQAIEEVFEQTTGQRQAAEAAVLVFEREINALQMLKQALEEARVAAKEQFFQPVMAELKPLLSLLLDEASITFDDTTLLPQTLARNGQDEDISVLSGGMREQLAILTRLAFARLLAKEGHPVPVILDDALVYSDDNRIERMFNALHRQASDLQILVFTCRQRAFEQLGGNELRMVDWVPQSRS